MSIVQNVEQYSYINFVDDRLWQGIAWEKLYILVYKTLYFSWYTSYSEW